MIGQLKGLIAHQGQAISVAILGFLFVAALLLGLH
jgi:hypothetical protein